MDLLICFLNGGLANQVFQYVFYRFLQLKRGSSDGIYLDDSFFFTEHIHNGYELERVFGLHPKLLSELFDEDVWEEMMRRKKEGKSVPQQLLELGEPIQMLMEENNYKRFNPFSGEVLAPQGGFGQFLPQLADLDGKWYLHFYGMHQDYFESFREVFLRELVFPPITDPRNLRYQESILERNSIGLHVRRGDFVSIGRAAAPETLSEGISLLLEHQPGSQLVIFSDDIPWCKAHEKELGLWKADRVLFIEGNTNPDNFRDLQLMSLCDGLIADNSSFACLAVLLDQRIQYLYNLSAMELTI